MIHRLVSVDWRGCSAKRAYDGENRRPQADLGNYVSPQTRKSREGARAIVASCQHAWEEF
jgi:hypothetical protein